MLSVRIEAVVTDLDGTVVRSDFSISPATLEALDLVRSAGVAFVIAAGLGAERHGARTAPETAASRADDADMSALSGVIAPETADISGC